MHKPINVEAQRIQKVIAETLVNLRTLSLLSSEVFEGIQGRQDEEILATFGTPVGGLLNSEAECEKEFESVNMTQDGLRMEPLDGDAFEDNHTRRQAIKNG